MSRQDRSRKNSYQIETKLAFEMEEEKPFYFCRLQPADAIVSVLLSYDDIYLTEGCREKHLALIIRDKIRHA